MAPMAGSTIAFDVTSTIAGRAGIARYVRDIGQALDELPGVDLRRFAVGRMLVPLETPAEHMGIPLRVIERSWARGGPPSVERLVGPVDSVHASGPALPTTKAPVIGVVHDLAPIDRPELHPARSTAQLRRYLHGLGRTAGVIAISQATADRLSAEAPGVPIHVVPYGHTVLPPGVTPRLADRRYVLGVGAPIQRKAFDVLLRAVARLDDDVTLVIVGVRGPGDPALEKLAAELGVEHRFVRETSVSDEELAGWYQHAAAVAVPSLDEGFSLPVVEGQDAGVPVVISSIAVHREVGGTAAWFVEPGSVDELAGALEEVVAGGAAVEQLAASGPANAARFSWARCAEGTLAVHRSVMR
jgi:glycosyltransferase involved in cell wall biosynthesis